MYIDTHAHIDDEQYHDEPVSAIIGRATEAGVKYIIAPGSDLESSLKLRTYADDHSRVFFAAGIHAHEASKFSEKDYLEIKKILSHQKAVAVGEIGLDYHYDFSPRAKQIEVFRRFLHLAGELDKPMIIHCREAEKDLHSILREEGKDARGVIHCYTGSREWARKFLDLGFYMGFTGIITFKNATDLRKVVEMTPIERILTETDSPYMTPAPQRKIRRNEPMFVTYIADRIAEIKGVEKEKAVPVFMDNARKCFKLDVL